MFILVSLLIFASAYGCFFFWERAHVHDVSVDSILARLHPLSGDVRELLKASEEGQLHYHPRVAWEMIGGLHGLLRLRRNVRLMLELAVHAEGWTGHLGTLFSEMVRRDALRLRSASARLIYAYLLRHRRQSINVALGAVLAIYGTTCLRVLTLYETTHAGLAPKLALSLGPS